MLYDEDNANKFLDDKDKEIEMLQEKLSECCTLLVISEYSIIDNMLLILRGKYYIDPAEDATICEIKETETDEVIIRGQVDVVRKLLEIRLKEMFE